MHTEDTCVYSIIQLTLPAHREDRRREDLARLREKDLSATNTVFQEEKPPKMWISHVDLAINIKHVI